MSSEKRLSSLNIVLPSAPKPAAHYRFWPIHIDFLTFGHQHFDSQDGFTQPVYPPWWVNFRQRGTFKLTIYPVSLNRFSVPLHLIPQFDVIGAMA